ncbi:hypothetical protein SRB5_16870 [Streptomyces sp. RB5]|uniref:Uncharacterized protein n=1 Tax=Streptomyces smaragdinus TaxID=2585196 RepID=A0A7K0CDM2_9ACTN|nr:hypothetical protein [Streptomyces smaragdinus]
MARPRGPAWACFALSACGRAESALRLCPGAGRGAVVTSCVRGRAGALLLRLMSGGGPERRLRWTWRLWSRCRATLRRRSVPPPRYAGGLRNAAGPAASATPCGSHTHRNAVGSAQTRNAAGRGSPRRTAPNPTATLWAGVPQGDGGTPCSSEAESLGEGGHSGPQQSTHDATSTPLAGGPPPRRGATPHRSEARPTSPAGGPPGCAAPEGSPCAGRAEADGRHRAAEGPGARGARDQPPQEAVAGEGVGGLVRWGERRDPGPPRGHLRPPRRRL